MKQPRTVRAALELAHHELRSQSQTPSNDAQVLLTETLSQSKTWVLAHPEHVLNDQQAQRFLENLSRCKEGEPLPYVLGWWEFYGRRFRLTPDVLIPRPETELMIEVACEFLLKHPDRRGATDVGTGSGCVGVTLCAEIEDLHVVATDLSRESLQVAQLNAREYGVLDRIDYIQSDMLSSISGDFDLVCANLPYIPAEELPTLQVANWEPNIALDGGRGGLMLIDRLLAELPRSLEKGGKAILEIGADQGEAVLRSANAALPESKVELLEDLAGRDRLLVISFERDS